MVAELQTQANHVSAITLFGGIATNIVGKGNVRLYTPCNAQKPQLPIPTPIYIDGKIYFGGQFVCSSPLQQREKAFFR